MDPVHPGDILAGKYRVERVLGSGGMGIIVAARHVRLDQLAAVKLLRRGLDTAEEAEATERFLREAKAAARLKNEHVARVYDVGTLETGHPYIVMEYLEGTDLAEMLKQRGALPVTEAVTYVLQACEALTEAHACGIIHRDIKPANLFVTRGANGAPLVKVLDFGVSKSLGSNVEDMTHTSAMLGSPRFMSPEQMLDARAVDPRSDVWSLGVVLYRLVSGQAPFEANSLGALLTLVMHEEPASLSARVFELPSGFESVVRRCLEKEPAKRFQSVADLANALTPYASADAHKAIAFSGVPMGWSSQSADMPTVSAPAANKSSTPGRRSEGIAASLGVWVLAMAVIAILVVGALKLRKSSVKSVADEANSANSATEASSSLPPEVAPAASTPPTTVFVAPRSPSAKSAAQKTAPGTGRKSIRSASVPASGANSQQPSAAKPDDGIPSTRQ
ncbi:MAG: protein kinase [Polyangiaceae bacterium]|nr:protein kinase [Polyangiaceae bacterium]